jgi:hypothetical protein
LGDHVEALIAAVRSVVAKAFDGGQHDARVDLAEDVVADAHAVHAARGLILGDDVRFFHHFQKDLFAFRVFQVEGNAPLVGIQRHEIGAVHAWPFRPSVAPRVSALRFFDFDHIGA